MAAEHRESLHRGGVNLLTLAFSTKCTGRHKAVLADRGPNALQVR